MIKHKPMKASLTRKINLQKYGGNQYESVDFFLEIEQEKITSRELKELENKIEDWTTDYIKRLPEQLTILDKAKASQPPF